MLLQSLCAEAAHIDRMTQSLLLIIPHFSLRPSRCCRPGRAGAAALPSEVRQAQGRAAPGLRWHSVSGCGFGVLIMLAWLTLAVAFWRLCRLRSCVWLSLVTFAVPAGLQAQQGEDTGPGDTIEDALQSALHSGATISVARGTGRLP